MLSKNKSKSFLAISVLVFSIVFIEAFAIPNINTMTNSSCYVCDYYDECVDADGNQSGGNSCDTSTKRCVLWGGECSPDAEDGGTPEIAG